MSYNINLCDSVSGEVLVLAAPHHMRGGTYQIGGCPEAHLNVTYNYYPHYRKVLGPTGVRGIYGLTGAESIPVLQAGIEQLGDDVGDNYWTATEGNARRALAQLLALARMRPDGVWAGD